MALSSVARSFARAAKDFAAMGALRPAQTRRQGEKRQALARPTAQPRTRGPGAALDGRSDCRGQASAAKWLAQGRSPGGQTNRHRHVNAHLRGNKKGEPKLPRVQTQPLSARDTMLDPPTTK